jgi:hypothetical protein
MRIQNALQRQRHRNWKDAEAGVGKANETRSVSGWGGGIMYRAVGEYIAKTGWEDGRERRRERGTGAHVQRQRETHGPTWAYTLQG